MLIEGADYFIRVVPFPAGGVDAFVTPNDDGTFSVYLDSNADITRRRIALEHELNHIRMEHFYSDKDIETIESEADGIAVAATRVPTESAAPDSLSWLDSWRVAMAYADAAMRAYGIAPMEMKEGIWERKRA